MTTIKAFSNLEQAKKLAEILPLESADMYYEWPNKKVHFKDDKQEWSEEDEKLMRAAFLFIEAYGHEVFYGSDKEDVLNWLKSLKERVQPKPTEWDEEDEVKINRIVACLKNLNVADNDILLKDVAWLKSLRPQNTWKPSEEQIIALRWVLNNVPYNKHKEGISGLLDQIKEL